MSLVRVMGARAAELLGSPCAALVLRDAITAEQEQRLVAELDPVLRRRRYARDHWDAVITGYKEVERAHWADAENEATVVDIRRRISGLVASGATALTTKRQEPHPPGDPAEALPLSWLPVHVIDLAADGFITPHVDSVKFSGDLVCGLSLLSPAVMTLRPDPDVDRDEKLHSSSLAGGLHADRTTGLSGGVGGMAAAAAAAGESSDDEHGVRMYLPPRSLYVLSGNARYRFTHSVDSGEPISGVVPADPGHGGAPTGAVRDDHLFAVFGVAFQRQRRISLIFRDAKAGEF